MSTRAREMDSRTGSFGSTTTGAHAPRARTLRARTLLGQGLLARGLGARGAIRAVVAAAFVAAAAPAFAQFAGNPSLANVDNAGSPANADSWSVATSADGTLVAFASEADNLVPQDNNGDTDVFLHDTVSGITSRVSVNYQGEEATGDSDCPAMSGDGRYVAFRSLAWNMAQGGQHLGTPIWQVYLHDRQGPSTIRVSVPLHGGSGTNHSGCPAMSADGRRIAFASEAADLVDGDGNGVADVFVYDVESGALSRASLAHDEAEANGPSDDPAISADGSVVAFTSDATNLVAGASPSSPYTIRQVYARDLAAESTELVSRAFVGPVHVPNGESCCPEISDDGSVVIFHSSASNLVSNASGFRPVRLFLRDRTADATQAVEPLSIGDGPCGGLSDPRLCDPGHTKGAALSGDGRFVSFLSGTFDLLPENPPGHRDQIFLQDRFTRRLRRVSVDPSGHPLHAFPCGGSSSTLALSRDGSVLAFAGTDAARLGLPEAGQLADRDVVRLDLTCDPAGGTCREISLCPAAPASACVPADKSSLRIRKNPPLAPRDDRFGWRWVGPGEGEGEAFVEPSEGRYHLCVYTSPTASAQLDAAVPAEGWKRAGRGWKRHDPGGALELVRFRSGPSRSLITVASSSAAIDIPYLPLEAPEGVLVQLYEATTNRCWEADFPESALRVNRRGELAGSSVTPGAVRADLRAARN